MINFKTFFNDESTAIGLTSLGLSKKLTNKNIPPKRSSTTPKQAATQTPTPLFLSNQNTVKPQLNYNNTEKIESINVLFKSNNSLNFNNNKLIG